MQVVSAVAAATTAFPLNAAANYNQAPGQDFISAMAEAYDAAVSPEIPKAAESVPAKEITPLEQYQAITGRTVAEEEPPAVDPKQWSDETFAWFTAGLLTGNNDYPIDTTKTINWASSGDHKLTAEEIAQLKEKYDVTNLSAQEYYDLMSDLTHMNVLSADEVTSPHIRHCGTGFMMVPEGRPTAKMPKLKQGDILKFLSTWLARLMEEWNWMQSDDFKKANAHLVAEGNDSWSEAARIDMELAQKLQDVMQQLQ